MCNDYVICNCVPVLRYCDMPDLPIHVSFLRLTVKMTECIVAPMCDLDILANIILITVAIRMLYIRFSVFSSSIA